MKLSNKFTLSRLIFAPIFFVIYMIPVWSGNSKLAFASACIMIPLLAIFQLTDYWDGHYARKNGEVSDFGKLFDPFADVMLNLTCFLCAMSSYETKIASYMPIIIFLLILYREFSQSFLRMLALKQGIAIAARKSGKIKTVFYIGSSFIMLAFESVIRLGLVPSICASFNIDSESLYSIFKITLYCLYGICLVLSYSSFLDYIKNFKSVFNEL